MAVAAAPAVHIAAHRAEAAAYAAARAAAPVPAPVAPEAVVAERIAFAFEVLAARHAEAYEYPFAVREFLAAVKVPALRAYLRAAALPAPARRAEAVAAIVAHVAP